MRNANFQSISWFWDLYQRGLLDLDPPYQRRSVWNQAYKEYFIDTILNGYPSPAIFLHQDISPEGISRFSVVDGKQRLSTVFDFASNVFPVSEEATIKKYQGKYFKDLDDTPTKKEFWGYQFSVEYLPSSDEGIINTIFDRINRNVAKLSFQELRHAKFDGEFISSVEALNDWMLQQLPQNFPSISSKSKKQMKDVEFTANLVLMLENGVKSYSQLELDEAFSSRDEVWESRNEIETDFRDIVSIIKQLLSSPSGQVLLKSRFKNQADFYSLFGAIFELKADGQLFSDIEQLASRLTQFARSVDSGDQENPNSTHKEYYDATRSASNDPGPRKTRIRIIKDVITGSLQA